MADAQAKSEYLNWGRLIRSCSVFEAVIVYEIQLYIGLNVPSRLHEVP